MLRKLCLLVLFVLMFGALIPAWAQDAGDKIELSAGYSYMRFKSSPASDLNGFVVSGQYKLRNWLGGVAEASGEYGKVGGVDSHVYTYVFGPQISWPRRISPFAHVLVGASYFTGGGFASRSFAASYGFGVDAKLKMRWSWRVVEADIVQTHLGGVSEHNTRVSTGIVFHF